MGYLPGQKMKVSVDVRSACSGELEEVLSKAGVLDLDLTDAHYDQFVVACKEKEIVGFGRIRRYEECVEVATLGVVEAEQKKGIGSAVVKELLGRTSGEVYLTTVIPQYFSRLGFKEVKDFPDVLKKKLDFCRSFGFHAEEIFVMKRVPGI
jgi:N-acetylglutamate synthase-like GNAT family acetyltransferase